MALFNDEIMNDARTLQQYDSSILGVASAEAIDITVKASLAQQEIATGLLLFLDRSVLEDPRSMTRRWVMVSDITVTDPLKSWHAYKTLAMIYRDAYNNQLNDRYKGKWVEYEALAGAAERNLYQAGIGVVHTPVPKADAPTLNLVPQAVTGVRYFLRVSWLNSSSQEGCASDVVEVASADGSAIVVATEAPVDVTFWNVYAGQDPLTVELQNALPIPIADTWTPESALMRGRAPGNGQAPECWIVDRHVLPRG